MKLSGAIRLDPATPALSGATVHVIVQNTSWADARAQEIARLDLEAHRARVTRALGNYRSQLTVDGHDIVHVGGEREPITVSTVLIGP